MNRRLSVRRITLALAAIMLAGGADAAGKSDAAPKNLAAFLREAKAVHQNLATFDELDFVVFTGQKWDRLRESHAANITVHWPDGHTTSGIETHIEDLK